MKKKNLNKAPKLSKLKKISETIDYTKNFGIGFTQNEWLNNNKINAETSIRNMKVSKLSDEDWNEIWEWTEWQVLTRVSWVPTWV